MNIVKKIDKYLSEGKEEEYKKFFKKKLKEFGVSSPGELDKKKRKQFFNEIELEWKGEKGD